MTFNKLLENLQVIQNVAKHVVIGAKINHITAELCELH